MSPQNDSNLVPAEARNEIATADTQQHADQMVTEMLNKSYALLSQAVAATQTDPMKVKDIKSYVATVEEAAKQKNVSRSIQLDAAEMSRRAEYWLEKALRDAEANGELATRADNNPSGKAKSDTQSADCTLGSSKPSRSTFVPDKHEASDLRKMGAATPSQFEQANREARAEDNPSRANVVRKIQQIVSNHPLPAKRKRPPLPDMFNTQIVQLNKTVGRITDLVEDDRFSANKKEVAVMVGSDIQRAIDQLTKVLEKLN